MGDGDGSPERSKAIITRFHDLNGKGRWTIIISLICIFLMVSLGWYALSTVRQDRFTEFYVLNENGQAFDYPNDINASENRSLIIGLANHEGRTVNYTVEIWLANFTFDDMAVNVTNLFFMDSFNIVLDDVPYKLDEDWQPQFERAVTLNFTTPGEYTLFIVLFNDGEPVLDYNGSPLMPIYVPPDQTVDYRTDPDYTWRVVLCMRQDLPFLRLVMRVI